MMYLVLLVFSDILFALNQAAIFVSSKLGLPKRVLRSVSESSPVVSSAYSMVSSSVERGRSFMKQEKRVGPRMVPWNTDMFRSLLSESTPFTTLLESRNI